MKGRFEIRDNEHPKERGQRFTSLVRAERELAHAVPKARFAIFDRETGKLHTGETS